MIQKYLVVFDTVPGGTGYLKQLMRSDKPMMEVFQLALDALKACPCNEDPDKDGCYQCLFAYKNSYRMNEISRDTAIELLSSILREKDHLVKTDTLKNVKVNVLFDSELEARFIEALRRVRSPELDVALTKEVVKGKPGYFLKIGKRSYRIEPQVKLGEKEGVVVPSTCDFVFRPARSQHELKPVAVFTDEFLYQRDRVGLDLAQRMAIVKSGRFVVWSLTWKDVQHQFHDQGDYFEDTLDPGKTPGGKLLHKMLEGYGLQDFKGAMKEGSFRWLVRYLSNPDEGLWRRSAYANGLCMIDAKGYSSEEAVKSWVGHLEERSTPGIRWLMKEKLADSFLGHHEAGGDDSVPAAHYFAAVEKGSVSESKPEGMRLLCCFPDGKEERLLPGFEASWTGMLRAYNLMQFIPRSFFVSTEGLKSPLYDDLAVPEEPAGGEKVEPAASSEWEQLKELVDPSLHGLVDLLAANGCPIPEPGYELMSGTSGIVGTAELAWEDKMIAALLGDEMTYQTVFEGMGWKVFALVEIGAKPDEFCSALKG